MIRRTAAALMAVPLLFCIGCGDDEVVFHGNAAIAYSPDGKTLAAVATYTSFEGDTILLLDAKTGDVKAALEGHEPVARSAAFSPDGKTLVSGGAHGDASIRVWDVETGAPLKTLDAKRGGGVGVVVAYSPDGRTLVSGSGGAVILWDAENWTERAIVPASTTNALAYSPDGQRIAYSAAFSQEIYLLDGLTGEPVGSLKGHRQNVATVAYSPDGKTLASGGAKGELLLWDSYTGKRIKKLKRSAFAVKSLAFSPDSKTLLSGGYGDAMRLWDVQTGKLIREIQDSEGAWSVVYSPDGTTIASGSLNAGVRLWNPETGEQVNTLYSNQNAVRFLAFSLDGDIIVYSDRQGKIEMLNAKTLAKTTSLQDRPYGSTGSAALSPDGKTLAAGSSGISDLLFWPIAAHHWDDDKRRAGREAAKKEFLERAKTIELNGGGSMTSRIAVSDLENAVQSNRYVYGFDIHFIGNVNCIAYSPDGNTLASGGGRTDRGTLVLSGAETPSIKAIIKGHKRAVRFVAFSPDGKTLASGGLDRTARFWDAETGAAIRDLKGHQGMAYAGAYSPDGKTLAVASSETLAVWDAATDALIHTLTGHEGPAYCLAFSPDGAEIATGGRDKTVRRWSAETGELIKTLEKHAAPVTAVAYSPDGAYLLNGGADGKIHRWSLNE